MTIDYRPISAMIQSLPSDCRWTVEERARWMKAMTAVVDLLVDVGPAPGCDHDWVYTYSGFRACARCGKGEAVLE